MTTYTINHFYPGQLVEARFTGERGRVVRISYRSGLVYVKFTGGDAPGIDLSPWDLTPVEEHA